LPQKASKFTGNQIPLLFLDMTNLKQLKELEIAIWHYDIQSPTNNFHDTTIAVVSVSSVHVSSKKFHLPLLKTKMARFSLR